MHSCNIQNFHRLDYVIQVNELLEKTKVLNPSQFGFHSGYSTDNYPLFFFSEIISD